MMYIVWAVPHAPWGLLENAVHILELHPIYPLISAPPKRNIQKDKMFCQTAANFRGKEIVGNYIRES